MTTLRPPGVPRRLELSLAKHLLLETWLARSLPLHPLPKRNVLFQRVLAERAEGLLLHPSRTKKKTTGQEKTGLLTKEEVREGKGLYIYTQYIPVKGI